MGNRMIGIAYLSCEQAQRVKEQVERLDKLAGYQETFWEERCM